MIQVLQRVFQFHSKEQKNNIRVRSNLTRIFVSIHALLDSLISDNYYPRAAIDVVGVVRHTHLQLMVQPAGIFCFFFLAECLQDLVIRDLLAEFPRLTEEISAELIHHNARQLLPASNLCDCPGNAEFLCQIRARDTAFGQLLFQALVGDHCLVSTFIFTYHTEIQIKSKDNRTGFTEK